MEKEENEKMKALARYGKDRYIVKTRNQVDQCRFSTAGTSDDRGCLSRFCHKVDVMKHIFLGTRISEVDMFETNHTVFDFHFSRIFCSFNRGLGLNDFVNSSGSMDTTFSFLN